MSTYDAIEMNSAKISITRKEVLNKLNEEQACFAHDHNALVAIIKSFNDEVFEFLLEQLATNTVTKHLSFYANVLKEQQAIQLIKLLETNQTIESLQLIIYNSPATTQAFAGLLKKNTHLKKIRIKCDNEGAIALAEALKENKSLTKLDLSLCEIEDEGAIALARALEENKSLTKLDLSHCEIGDEGAKAIAEALEENSSLRELDLSCNNERTKKALSYFCRAFKFNKTLEKLNIYNDNIKSYVDAKYLRSPKCKYNKPDDDSINTTTETSPPAKNVSASTKEKQKDGDNQQHEPECNPSDEQPAGGSSLDPVDTSSVQTEGHEVNDVPAAGELSDT